MGRGPRFGIDLGGTKTEIVVLDADGAPIQRERTPTPPDFDGTVATIGRLVRAADERFGPGSVGVGIPGSPSPRDGRIRNANSTWLLGHDLRGALSEELGREVRVANDANCFVVSEAADGAAAGARSVFGVILGTGVGGGVVVDGDLHSGATGIAGEWGHTPLPVSEATEFPGPECWCGRRGCVERWLSGPGMADDHHRVTGQVAGALEIEGAATAGDAAARATIERWMRRLGRALAGVVNLLDPEVIVLGGGVSNLPELPQRLPPLIEPHVFSDVMHTRIARAVHGDSSGVLGAARLWDQAPPAN